MRSFEFSAPATVQDAVAHGAAGAFIGGGTTLIDLMKLDVLRPARLVDVTGIEGLRDIAITEDAVHFGALVTMAEAAADAELQRRYPVLTETLALAASAQLRNMATLGGNVLQRTRCGYFRDARTVECNKREPGSGCAALTGNSRAHAILGTSAHCIASYPGDWAQALIALDAEVEILGQGGPRTEKFSQLHRLPGDTPWQETNLKPGELITGFTVRGPWPRSRYVKIRDRESYEFGLATAAVALRIEAGRVEAARIGLGGVATIPWRATEAEAALQGRALDAAAAEHAARIAFQDARTTPDNAYKLKLGQAALIRALTEAAEMPL